MGQCKLVGGYQTKNTPTVHPSFISTLSLYEVGCVSCANRKLRANMENMTLMLVLLLIEGLAVGQSTVGQSTERGFVGGNVLLSCPCPDKPEELVWQIDERVVSVHSQSKDDINTIDKTFINRTQLFLHMDKENCSMLLLNVSWVDAGVYSCHALNVRIGNAWSFNRLSEVNLTVSENKNPKRDIHSGEENTSLSSVHIGIPILLLIIILAAGLLLILLFRRKRQNHQNIIYVPAETMKNTV